MLTNANVARAIQEWEAEAARRLELDRQRVVQELQAAIELGRIQADLAAMIRGWVETAKMCGFYAPERKQVELSASGAELAFRVRKPGGRGAAGAGEPREVARSAREFCVNRFCIVRRSSARGATGVLVSC